MRIVFMGTPDFAAASLIYALFQKQRVFVRWCDRVGWQNDIFLPRTRLLEFHKSDTPLDNLVFLLYHNYMRICLGIPM